MAMRDGNEPLFVANPDGPGTDIAYGHRLLDDAIMLEFI